MACLGFKAVAVETRCSRLIVRCFVKEGCWQASQEGGTARVVVVGMSFGVFARLK